MDKRKHNPLHKVNMDPNPQTLIHWSSNRSQHQTYQQSEVTTWFHFQRSKLNWTIKPDNVQVKPARFLKQTLNQLRLFSCFTLWGSRFNASRYSSPCTLRRYSPPSTFWPTGNSSPTFIVHRVCLTLYVLAIKLYWQANKMLMAQLVHNVPTRHTLLQKTALTNRRRHKSLTLTKVTRSETVHNLSNSPFLLILPFDITHFLFSGTNQLNQ